jgi:hypothetical protein
MAFFQRAATGYRLVKTGQEITKDSPHLGRVLLLPITKDGNKKYNKKVTHYLRLQCRSSFVLKKEDYKVQAYK